TATHRVPGMVLKSHEFQLPLNYAHSSGEQLTIFAREIVAAGKENADLPMLVYLQGGPGSAAPRPTENSGWWKRALQEYRVLMLDQRGTGRSTPVLTETLARFPSPQAQVDYLKHFRADNIVRDAEQIRIALLGEGSRWTILGQSYGGFCAVRYLSAAPDGLATVLITGGLPSLTRPADDVYRATYKRVLAKNQLYYERYPDDVARAQAIVRYLQDHDVRLPDGAQLTPRRFQQLGLSFGASDGFETIHYLLEEAFVRGADGPMLGYPFLSHLMQAQHYETNPIFAILHESIYCQGTASNWSAERLRAEYPHFEPHPDRPIYFTGEMIYPWMFAEYPHLKPLREAANVLAATEDWPQLYDVEQLRRNQVPCAAAVYYNDMYVERAYSEETAREIGGIQLWITNQYEHNALRADGEALLDRLLQMVRGER
ncbi:MAG TPA: alpha/beta fold hydrolase, partial [Caldilineaceae bacterium]|nr:alpha/beta fold hydrolase [Caldilineaceae bacterium]